MTCTKDQARMRYKFNLEPSATNRCADCRHQKTPDWCRLLCIRMADARKSRCELHEQDHCAAPVAAADSDVLGALLDGLKLAANRLHSLSIDQPQGSRKKIIVQRWAEEARALLAKVEGK